MSDREAPAVAALLAAATKNPDRLILSIGAEEPKPGAPNEPPRKGFEAGRVEIKKQRDGSVIVSFHSQTNGPSESIAFGVFSKVQFAAMVAQMVGMLRTL